MSDPRSYTVKQCTPSYAAKSGAAIASSTNSRRDFFGSLGKIGDLNVLADIGLGRIGSGLRNLASISNTIRIGTGYLPTSIGQALDSGANWVLGKTGIANGVVDAVREFNPSIANAALGQAKSVFTQVKQGGFHLNNIPTVLQDFQNLERLGRNIFTPNGNDVQTQLTERCDASPYAIDLIQRAPKFKFLYIVQFIPEMGYEGLGSAVPGPLDMAFTVKTSTRPGVKFHQEDVNYYNYRTKVVTKTDFEEINMTFHDDTQNLATQFYKAYLRAMSPISGLYDAMTDPNMLEKGGMSFTGNHLNKKTVYGDIKGSSYASSTGLLVNGAKRVFKEIRIYHIYDFGNSMNVFRMSNPQINHLAMDDLDMSSSSEGSQISITFTYDSLYIDADVSLGTTNKYNIGDLQRNALYPLHYVGDGVGGGPGVSPLGSRDGRDIADDVMGSDGLKTLKNSFGEIGGAIGAVKGAISSATGAINGGIAGAEAAISGAINGAIDGAIGSVKGAVGGAIGEAQAAFGGAVSEAQAAFGGAIGEAQASLGNAVAEVQAAIPSISDLGSKLSDPFSGLISI